MSDSAKSEKTCMRLKKKITFWQVIFIKALKVMLFVNNTGRSGLATVSAFKCYNIGSTVCIVRFKNDQGSSSDPLSIFIAEFSIFASV